MFYDYTEKKLAITHNSFRYVFTYDGMGRTRNFSIAGSPYSINNYTLAATATVETEYASGEKMKVATGSPLSAHIQTRRTTKRS